MKKCSLFNESSGIVSGWLQYVDKHDNTLCILYTVAQRHQINNFSTFTEPRNIIKVNNNHRMPF